MRTKPLFIFLLASLVFGGLAVGQSILGSMFKLGSSTTAGLPTSSTTIAGALLFDSDAGVVRYNDGTAWQTPPVGATYSGSLPPGGTGAAGTIIAHHRMLRPGRGDRLSFVVTAAGTGGGTYTVEVYDLTTATSLCSRVAVACTTAANTISSGTCSSAVWAAADDLQLRVDTSGCTLNPGLTATVGIVGP